ncbi:hypothetical protein HK102_006575 [Quaeritorhiza haematococci]|nr:hypothetical protein HK102_006575 [Quaeritorhiza haematococci]
MKVEVGAGSDELDDVDVVVDSRNAGMSGQVPASMAMSSGDGMSTASSAPEGERKKLQVDLETLAVTEGNTIPHIIHQSWKTRELPSKFLRWSDTWKENHPTWKHILWTDNENRLLVERYYPWFLPHYDALPKHIMRVDAARILYMHRYGGVYVDLDVESTAPMDEMFSSVDSLLRFTLPEDNPAPRADVENQGEPSHIVVGIQADEPQSGEPVISQGQPKKKHRKKGGKKRKSRSKNPKPASDHPLDQPPPELQQLQKRSLTDDSGQPIDPEVSTVNETIAELLPCASPPQDALRCHRFWKDSDDMGVVLASMGPKNQIAKFPHSFPNAWMASRPGHPFWLFCLDYVMSSFADTEDPIKNRNPEFVAGPVMLHRVYYDYIEDCGRDPVFILDADVIFPYSWEHDKTHTRICSSEGSTFDAKTCRNIFVDQKEEKRKTTAAPAADGDNAESETDSNPTDPDLSRIDPEKSTYFRKNLAISYWSHSWGHDNQDYIKNENGLRRR